MSTKKQDLKRFIAKRVYENRLKGKAPSGFVLGFVRGKDIAEAADKAYTRWGLNQDGDMLVLVPINEATDTDITKAMELAEEDVLGPNFGKRMTLYCPRCSVTNFYHPLEPTPLCGQCGKHMKHAVRFLVDLGVESRGFLF